MSKKIFSSAPYLASAAFAKRLADDYRDKGAIIQSLGLTANNEQCSVGAFSGKVDTGFP
jgi:hypothetical protein